MVGLGNVNNTSDANKPISNATQTALNLVASLAAPLASPTFTGTATAPTINATTSLKVGGIDISTIYQTISGMASYITSSSLATTLGSYLTSATASSTYASKTATTDQSFAGNIVVGTGKSLSTPAISLNSVDLTTTLAGKASLSGATFTGSVLGPTASTSDSSTKLATTAYVQSNLANYQSQHWVAGRITSTAGIKTSSGQQTFTIAKGATGSGYYKIQWTTGHPNGNAYGVLLSTTSSYYCTYGTFTSTYLEVYMFNPGGAAADQEFTFMTVP
jgi:hypothetical protein